MQIDNVNKQRKKKGSTKKSKQCDECGKGFDDQYKLRRHVESVHQKIKNFECTSCDFKFYSKYHLDRHNRSHILKSELPELPDIPFREEME